MAFPASPSNNDVHKEGNRAFVWDSTLGVWDQVRETDRSENKTITSDAIAQGNLTVVGDLVPSTPLSHRNLIINGDMNVAQRSASAVTQADNSNEGYATVDRWNLSFSTSIGGSVTTTPQSTDTPGGFGTALKLECASTHTPSGSGQKLLLYQPIEAQNCHRLGVGVADAKPFVLSWYMKRGSTDWGNISVLLITNDGTSQFYCVSFTPTTSWARYELALPANTAGQMDNNNGGGIEVAFILDHTNGLGASSDSTAWSSSTISYRSNDGHFLNSTNNDFFITGVQLELGSNATPFEHRSYGEELARCQRYCVVYRKLDDAQNNVALAVGNLYATDHCQAPIQLPTAMRTSPTATSSTGDTFLAYSGTDSDGCGPVTIDNPGATTDPVTVSLSISNLSIGVVGQACAFRTNSASAYLHLVAEL